MNTASEATRRSSRMFRTAGWFVSGVVAITVGACSGALPTSPAAETVVLHQYARGYTADAKGPKGGKGPAAACADTGTVAMTIGDHGGTLSLGGTTLAFPNHNGLPDVTITMVLLPGTASVQFFPEGLVFKAGKQPTLTINTDCIDNPDTSDIVYTDNSGLILETNPSFHADGHSVSALINHFSRYAVNW